VPDNCLEMCHTVAVLPNGNVRAHRALGFVAMARSRSSSDTAFRPLSGLLQAACCGENSRPSVHGRREDADRCILKGNTGEYVARLSQIHAVPSLWHA
jgi:hypothetical protein